MNSPQLAPMRSVVMIPWVEVPQRPDGWAVAGRTRGPPGRKPHSRKDAGSRRRKGFL